MTYETIEVEPGTITHIRLNRPERRNAINRKLESELREAMWAADEDRECHCIVLSGNGPCFSAGHDLYEVAATYAGGGNAGDSYIGRRSIQEDIWNINTPTIAAVHGFVGPHACYVAASCDLIVAAENTRFSMEQMRRGGANGFPLITFIIGEKRYKEWRLLAKVLDAKVAKDWGLVNSVVPLDQLMTEADQWAEWVSLMPPQNATANKLSVNKDIESLGIWELNKLGFHFGRMGHGSQSDVNFFEKVIGEGLKPSLKDRDAAYEGQEQKFKPE